jgi:hypothetical protein
LSEKEVLVDKEKKTLGSLERIIGILHGSIVLYVSLDYDSGGHLRIVLMTLGSQHS